MNTIDETRHINANLDAIEKLIHLQLQEIRRLHEENRQLSEAHMAALNRAARLEKELERLGLRF